MKEPKEYEKNVHFWLRKIFYFVHFVDAELVTVLDENQEKERMEQQAEDPNKGESERVLRGRLKAKDHLKPKENVDSYDANEITKAEAEEACRKLYEMFNMPLDEDVVKYMDDRRCAGGWPRSM
ncbi:MAG: hypothetical protein GTO17_02345 [Candidatus Aminicenantes bacterium]|nr:hypothetical protein [Candidatus Aminicenantes bacterium]